MKILIILSIISSINAFAINDFELGLMRQAQKTFHSPTIKGNRLVVYSENGQLIENICGIQGYNIILDFELEDCEQSSEVTQVVTVNNLFKTMNSACDQDTMKAVKKIQCAKTAN